MDCDCNIFTMPLFEGSDMNKVNRILDEFPGRSSEYRKGDIIAMQGYACKSIFMLCSGSAYAKMSSEEGKELTLDTLAAPEVLASPFIFSTEGIYPVTIIAASDCSIQIIGKECLLRLTDTDPAVRMNFMRVLSDHSMFLSRRLNEFALQTLSSRIISYIEHHGILDNLQETAFILGVARPSLSRAVSQLASQGILGKTDNGYILAGNIRH